MSSVSAQSINTDDLRNALVSAIKLSNSTREEPLRFIKFYNLHEYKNDSIIEELNKNDEGFIFYKEKTRSDRWKLFANKIKKNKFYAWRIYFLDVKSNRITIVINELSYKRFGKSEIHCGARFVCRKSGYSGNWHAANEIFVSKMIKLYCTTDYSVLTKQLYDKLHSRQLESENDYILLLNYLRKQDDSEYYPKIKELLKYMIGENPEINECVQTYLYMIQETGYGDTGYVFYGIEQNYNKILN